MDVRRLLVITRKWALLLVAGVILAAGAAFGFSMLQPKTYEARTTLIVGQALTSASPDYTGLLTSQQLSTTYAAIATTRPQLDAVIAKLGLQTTSDSLLKRVSAETATGSTLLVIRAQDSDPGQAAAIANELATQLVAATSTVEGRQEDLQAAIDADLQATQEQILRAQDRVALLVATTPRTVDEDAELATLEDRLVTLRSTYATLLGYSSAGATNLLSVVEPAVAPGDAIAPKIPLNVLVAAVLGLLGAAGIALLAEFLNESVGTAEDVERLTGTTTLASVGVMKSPEGQHEFPQLAALIHPRSPISEAYRTLRANLAFAAVDSGLSSVAVTSARPGEGKTVTAANLAIVFAQVGKRVLLIDADLRRPTIHTALGLRNDIGLTTALVVGNVASEALVQATAQPNLSVLACGPQPPNPAELLSSQRMRTLIERAEASYDIVILDTAPLCGFADAAVLASITSGTVLVVDAERSKRRTIQEARETLTRAGATVLGTVFNRVPGIASDLAAQYGGYYQGGTAPAQGADAAPVATTAALMTASPVVDPARSGHGPTPASMAYDFRRATAAAPHAAPGEAHATRPRADAANLGSVPVEVVDRIRAASMNAGGAIEGDDHAGAEAAGGDSAGVTAVDVGSNGASPDKDTTGEAHAAAGDAAALTRGASRRRRRPDGTTETGA